MRPNDGDVLELEALRGGGRPGPRTLCRAPWVQLAFWPDGDVTFCSASQPQPIGNVQDASLLDLWRGPGVAAYRAQLRDHEFPKGCIVCHNDLAAGRREALVLRGFDEFAIDDAPAWPRRMEFSLSNTCNLTCVMCSGRLSSGLRRQEGLPPLPKVYGDRFFAELAAFLPHLEAAAFKGGEPFLEAECRRIWDQLIAAKLAPLCHITTNGTVWNERVERVLHELPCNLAVSVDGVTPGVVEAIRQNCRFDELMANVRRFQAHAQGNGDRHAARRRRRLQLNFTVQRLNWRETADFFAFAEDLGAEIWCAIVHGPSHCSLLTLPEAELAEVVTSLEAASPRLEPRLAINRGRWFELLAELRGWQRGRQQGRAPGAFAAAAPTPMQRAHEHYARGDLSGAVAVAKSVPTDHPERAEALAFAGGILTDRGDLEDAERCLRAARAADPNLLEPVLRMAWLEVVRTDYVAARVHLAAAKQASRRGAPPPVEAVRGMLLIEACLEVRDGAPARAMPLLQRLLASDPDHAGVRELYAAAKAAGG